MANSHVRANYKNIKKNVYATNKYLERFLENLLLSENNILKNRELHIEFVPNENTPNLLIENDTEKQENDTEKLGVNKYT